MNKNNRTESSAQDTYYGGVSYVVDKKYSDKTYPYPKSIDPKKKNDRYCLAMAQAIYSTHVRNCGGIYYSDQMEFNKLRAYAQGDQSEELYKEYFSKEQDEISPSSAPVSSVDGAGGFTQTPTGKRKGYMNVLWEVISTAPKIRNALLRKFERAEYEIVADAIDPRSRDLEEQKKWRLWTIGQDLDFIRNFTANGGLQMPQPEYLPETLEELDVFQINGGFKSEFAKAMELLIFHTMNVSNWDEIKMDMLGDAIDIAIFGCKDYYDEVTGTVKSRRVDPAMSVVQYSKKNDFSDSEYAGEFVTYSISQLREHGFKESDIEKIARDFAGWNNNPDLDMFKQYNVPGQNSDEGYLYDFYKVCVLDCEWIDVDSYRSVKFKNRFGKERVFRKDVSDKVENDSRTSSQVIEYRVKYGCKWIVGTDFVFDYGKVHDIIRPTDSQVSLSYHFYKLSTKKSITKQLIPVYDNFQILWLKYQNAIAMAVNSGYVIDYDSISNLRLGGKANSEKEILRRFLESGILIVKSRPVGDRTPGSSSGIPVQELKGGMGAIFNDIREGFLVNFSIAENITGLSPLSLGGSPDPDAPVKTSEISLSATENTIGMILSSYLKVKKSSAGNWVLWIQLILKDKKRSDKGYKDVISSRDLEVLRTADANMVRYGISLVPRPTDSEKREIYETAKISLQNGRDGKPGINEADFFEVMHLLNSRTSFRLAEMLLSYRIRKAQKEAQQRSMELMAQQGEENRTSEIMKTQGEIEIIKEKGEQERQTEFYKAIMEIFVKNPDKHLRDEAMAELQSKLRQIEQETAAKMQRTNAMMQGQNKMAGMGQPESQQQIPQQQISQ